MQETWRNNAFTCKTSLSRLHFWFILISFNFFFPKSELLNSGCGLSASAAYTPVFTVGNKPVYFKNYREAGITYTHDLLFDRDINVAFTHLSNKINKTNFLQLAGLRHSIPSQLRSVNVPLSTLSPSFTFKNNTFDIRQKRSKDYYSLLVSRKAQHPNITVKL